MDYFRGTADVHKNNLQAISDFPHNDDGAMLKANGGALQRADSTTWSIGPISTKGLGYTWAKGYLTGTPLKDTAAVIAETSRRQFDDIKNKISEVAQLNSRGKVPDAATLRFLTDAIKDEQKLEQGIGNITRTYTQRYAGDPNHEGLRELQQIYAQCKKDAANLEGAYDQLLMQIDNTDLTTSILMPEAKNAISDEQAATSLSDYCAKWSPYIRPAEAQKMISEGEEIFNSVMKQDAMPGASEHKLAALTWYLMSQAIKQGVGFDEGTFVIEDPKGQLYSYLMSANPHQRPSSHYEGRSSIAHHGLDITNEPMPAHKRTLLFEKIDSPLSGQQPLLYLKPENFSANPKQIYDFAMHAKEFGEAQYNKVMHPGSDDLPSMRKERVPNKEFKAFKKLIDGLKESNREILLEAAFKGKDQTIWKGDLTFENAERLAKKYGIAFMNEVVKNLSAYIEAGGEFPLKKAAEVKELSQLFNQYDHLEYRTGREVIIEAPRG